MTYKLQRPPLTDKEKQRLTDNFIDSAARGSPIKKSDKIEKRKEAIKGWLKDKYNLIFLAILILAIIIYLNNFNLTKTQVLWWDEADYLAYAKNLAGFPINWIVTEKHNSLYSYLAAAFFKIGLEEPGIKFFFAGNPCYSVSDISLFYI